MKKNYALLMCAGIAATSWAVTPAKINPSLPQSNVTVLQTEKHSKTVSRQVVRDAAGHIYRRNVVEGHARGAHRVAPVCRESADSERTYYEGFEGYYEALGLNWLPSGWTKIDTPEHTPTPENVAHNINNSWYAYYSLDGWGFSATTDGECDAFIHFGYDSGTTGYGCTAARQDEWLVSPAITLSDNETLRFLHEAEPFSVYPIDWNAWDVESRDHAECNMKVMLSTDGGENWTEIWDYEQNYIANVTNDYIMDSMMEWNEFAVSLSDYAGQTVNIAFRYLRDEGDFVGNSMCVDAVIVDHPASAQGDWRLLGTGSMADGWVTPALTLNAGEYYDPADYVFPVRIYQSNSNPGLYKLASPYTDTAFPFLNLNGNTTVAYDIIIDATDPAFVTVEPQISGFEHNNPGSKASRYAAPYYISNAATYYLSEGNSREDIIAYGYASTFSAEEGKIVINHPQYGHMLANGTLDMGYSCGKFTPDPTVITLPAAAPEAQWTWAGEGHFVDGFLYAGYFGNPIGNGWNVDVYTKEDAPGVYMVKDPYTNTNSPFAGIHVGDVSSTMVKIDASNPDLVIMEPQYSGFNGYFNSEVAPYYIGNTAGYYVATGTSVADLQYLSDDSKDKMVNDVITINKCFFGTDSYADFGYNWIDEDENPIFFPAKLYLPWSTETPNSVTAVTSSSESAGIFNLQGVRLGTDVNRLPSGIYIIGGRKVVKR